MDPTQQRAILKLCFLAAAADGNSDYREHTAIARVADAWGGGLDVAALADEVRQRGPDLAQLAADLRTPEARKLAYEAGVGVCNADGAASPAEQQFLARLAQALDVPAAAANEVAREAATVAAVPPSSNALDGALVAAVPANDADLDKMILNYAILNGALELLPQSLASMAIIPLQMRMVYRIGKAHGYELDSGHIKDLLATLGVGLTSQYVEQFGRKLMGGLLGSIGGGVTGLPSALRASGADSPSGRPFGLMGGLVRAGTGAAFSFATTYALGEVAKRYYAGGRTLDTAKLQQAFAEMLASARTMQGKYTQQIADQARSLDLSKVLSAVRA